MGWERMGRTLQIENCLHIDKPALKDRLIGTKGQGESAAAKRLHQGLKFLLGWNLEEMDDLSTWRSIHSLDLNGEPQISTISGRKRKLQYDKGRVFPSSKFKFRDRFHESDDGDSSSSSLVEETIVADDPPDVGDGTSNGPNNCTMEWDKFDPSTGPFGGSNGSTLHNSNKMAVDTGNRSTTSFEWELHRDRPSTSSGSCSNNSLGNSLHSMESNSRNKGIVEQDNLEGGGEEEDGSEAMELKKYMESLYEFEAFSNLLGSEIETSVVNKCFAGGGSDDDSLPHSSGLTSNLHARTLGDKPVAKKQTIDQEFEQYFSSLMLEEML